MNAIPPVQLAAAEVAFGQVAPAPTFVVTIFGSFSADQKREETLTLLELAERIRRETAREKARLPWLKLARFGDTRTDANSLRHDANLLEISGIEADYDGEQITFEQAQETLMLAGVEALLYTSPSHTPEKPRWRVLCPLSKPMPPQSRHKLLARLNGLFRGQFSGESWTLSQSYYFGSVNRNPAHQVELLDGMNIDELDELDMSALGKPHTIANGAGSTTSAALSRLDEPALLAEIASGASYHLSSVRLLGKWAVQGCR